jgi:hypothetical protein
MQEYLTIQDKHGSSNSSVAALAHRGSGGLLVALEPSVVEELAERLERHSFVFSCLPFTGLLWLPIGIFFSSTAGGVIGLALQSLAFLILEGLLTVRLVRRSLPALHGSYEERRVLALIASVSRSIWDLHPSGRARRRAALSAALENLALVEEANRSRTEL